MVLERLELEPLVVTEVLGIEQPQLLAPGQAGVPCFLEDFVFLATDLIYGFVEMLTDVKPIMHDFGLRGVRRHGGRVGRPHVDGGRLDLGGLLFGQGLPQSSAPA